MENGELRMETQGKLIMITGPMFAGKTTALMDMIEERLTLGRIVLVCKPAKDQRYDAGDRLSTHDGKHTGALGIATAEYILDAEDLAEVGVVVIDEAHFLKRGIASVVRILTQQGKEVILAGLWFNYRGKVFTHMAHLATKATEHRRLKARCGRCGEDAEYSLLLGARPKNWVGGKESWEPRCAACFMRASSASSA